MTSIRRYNPEGIAVPASRYVHAVLTTDATRWLHLAGQIGIAPDGQVAERRARVGGGLTGGDCGVALCLAATKAQHDAA